MPVRPRLRRYGALTVVSALAGSLISAQPAAALPPPLLATVSTDRASYAVAEGGQVTVTVTVTTEDRNPLTAPVSVSYATGAGTATADGDYTPVTGTLDFPAGTASGGTAQFTVAVGRDATSETAETVPVTLTAGAGVNVVRQPVVVINAHGLPYLDSRLPVDRRVADLLGRMTLEEKIGQMTQAERGAVASDPTLIAQWQLGSLLSGGGSTPTPNTPAAWVAMVNEFQAQALSTRLQIPLIYGIDAVHGHGNAYGATIFPHNIGLGATRNPALVERTGHVTATEVRATGIPWNFAPCLCVARDERWGRTYESFSEDPALVTQLETIIDGLQGRRGQLDDPDRVLATAKHYAGDGDTEYDLANPGAPIDQGITVTNRRDFARIDLAPYGPAVRRHDVGSVMPSFSSVDWTEDGVGNPIKMHANRELITETLKGRLGFDGFVITDWNGIHQIPDPALPGDRETLTAHKVQVAVNAGNDMFMEPFHARQFEELLLAEVNAGRVGQDRIDDAVRRILRKKVELGLFEQPYASAANTDVIGSAAHRAVARQAAAESQVLLKNAGNALPLRPDARVYVAGRNADNIGNQAGGWTIQWQGVTGDALPGTTVLEGIREVAPGAQVTYSVDASAPTADAEVGVVVVGETGYAEGFGDVGGPVWPWGAPEQREPKSLSLQPEDRAVVDRVCSAIATCVVLVVSGRPQVIGDQLGSIDALVASWLPGSEGAGVADVLFGRRPFTGRLPMTWPRTEAQVPINVGDANYDPAFPYGWGLRTDPARARLAAAVAADGGYRPAARHLRDALAPANWNADGSVRNREAVLRALRAATQALGRSRQGSPALGEAIVSVARDLAQASVVAGRAPADWARLVADADHALALGDAARALTLLSRV
ncbi:MAG TPA: glycoside hydrolase family 3 N-terminal domain-containing protein [Micromonosporaceae bacterium]|nr:glycoside hydrolase family 3 N-terminal domain-containing protein [Micromonosporaceae bacterium]